MSNEKFDMNEMMRSRAIEQAETGGRDMARMVKGFYDELIDSGMSREVAMSLSMRFISDIVAAIFRNKGGQS